VTDPTFPAQHHTIVGDRKAKMTPTKRNIINNSSIFEEPVFSIERERVLLEL
jgi:hypothetical protein